MRFTLRNYAFLFVTLACIIAVAPADSYARQAVRALDQVSVLHPVRQTTERMAGSFPIRSTQERNEGAMAFVAEHRESFKLEHPDRELKLVRDTTDEFGLSHLRFDQTYQGLPVWGCQTIVHFAQDNSIYLVAGQTIPTPTISTIPSLGSDRAVSRALETLKDEIGDSRVVTKTQLLIYPDRGVGKLAWLVSATSTEHKPLNWQVFINATDGSVLDRYNDVCTDGPLIGSGVDLLGNTQPLSTYQTGSSIRLIDASQPMYVPPVSDLHGVITTYSQYEKNGSIVADPNGDNVFSDNLSLRAAVSAHRFAELSWEYFYNTFGYVGWGGASTRIIVNVHDSMFHNNAYYWAHDTTPWMGFSNGDGTVYREFCSDLDVVGHEFSHGVVWFTTPLIYRYESGALNESMADFFGNMIDRSNWLLGDQLVLVAPFTIRNMQDPHIGYPNNRFPFGAQPSHMSEFQEVPITFDNGGVHMNSGIPNRVGYLVANSIGREKAEQIWFRTLTQYLTIDASFEFWASMLTVAASDLYGQPSAELDAVEAALDSVGFGRVLAMPDKISEGLIPLVGAWDTTVVLVARGVDSITITGVQTAAGKFEVTGNFPTTLGLSEQLPITVTFDPVGLGACDVGYIYDTVVLTTTSPVTPVVRVPVRTLFGYFPLGGDSTTLKTTCLDVVVGKDAGVNGLYRHTGEGILTDPLRGLGSLLIGTVDGDDTLMYAAFHDSKTRFFAPNIMPLDSFTRAQAENGDSLISVPFATYDGKLQGQLRYQFEPQAGPAGCDYISVSYVLSNQCDAAVTAVSGMLFSFDFVNDSFFVDGANNLSGVLDVPSSASSDTTAVAIVKLGTTARNSRLIYHHGPGQLPIFQNGWVYREMLQTINGSLPGASGDMHNLVTFGLDTLGPGETVTYRGAILYSTGGVTGLRATLSEINPPPEGCCAGTTGNVNATGIVDLADLSWLVAYLTVPVPGKPLLPCTEEANVNGFGIVDLGDLSLLVAYLTVPSPNKPVLPSCP